ncbi:mutator type transposase [Tanacetum coccineum]
MVTCRLHSGYRLFRNLRLLAIFSGKLKESVHAIQVGCQICKGPHLDKDCPLNEEVKKVEEVKYGEFRRTAPFNGSNGGKFRVGPPRYYTKIDNHPSYGKKRQSLEEVLAKHQEESTQRSTEMELTKEIRSDKTLDSSSEQLKTITVDQETFGLNKLHGVSVISDPESDTTEVLQHQLPHKELNPRNFTLPCMIGKFNFCAMADLGASINVMPRSIFEHLHHTNLRKIGMLCEMADMSKKAPLGIVENVFVNIDNKRRNIKGKGLSFPDFLLAKYGKSQTDALIWDSRYDEWCDISPSFEASSQESNKPRPRDYTFREWTLIKVGHTDISEPVKKALLKLSLIDCFQGNSACENNPTHRSFDDYKWEFNLEIDKLSGEYELGIGKKGHILDHVWEYCNQVHNKNYEWHNYEFENEECEEIGIEDKEYHPPEVQVETFEGIKSLLEDRDIDFRPILNLEAMLREFLVLILLFSYLFHFLNVQ